jgi:CHAT domain-containing protein/tetratricopeptide (TPR) repeat protein
MNRVVLLAALVLACGCARDPERRLASTFDEARLAARRGELNDARAIADRGLAMAPPASEWDWSFRLLRGEILLLQRQPSEVVPLIRASLPDGPAFGPLRARQKFLEALLQRSQNHFADALTTLEAARQLAPDARDVQFDIGWLDGQLRMRLGQWTDAETRLNAFIARAAAAGDRFQQARALNDLGMGGVARGRWDEALPRFERVLSFQDLESLAVYATALYNAGICYSRLGEFERALATQRRSVELHTNRGTRVDFEHALGELGNTLQQQGDARQALLFYQQALKVSMESGLEADAALWAGNLASANVDLGDWNEAERFNDDAKRLRAASRTGNLVHNTLNDAHIALGRGRLDDATRLYGEALAGAGIDPIIRWSAHAGLADVALAGSNVGEASRHFEAALDTIEKARSELLKTDYKLTFLTRLILFYQSYVDALITQGRVDRALEVSESSRGRVLAERNRLAPPPKASTAALQQIAARSGSVLLSYWLGASRSYVWAVTATGVHHVRLPPASEIGALVQQYRATVNNAMADPLAASGGAGDRLYQLLVEPLLPWVPSGSHIVIAADGALHGINFETLPVPGAKRHYWIEDAEIEMAPALSMLSVARRQSDRVPSLLLFGDPAPRAPEFPALKFAAAEIANVSKHFPADAVTNFQGDRASPSAYKAAAPDRFTFVHFTAHAAANLESPLDSAVILAGPDHAYKLYARDVAEMPLRAELVTVSACRSAGERAYSGEGLIGFAWAFLRAGASRVIAGLWDVDDRSTADVMEHLYAHIAAGETAARALREAKLSLLAKGGNYGKPYYWGPFQVFTVVR